MIKFHKTWFIQTMEQKKATSKILQGLAELQMSDDSVNNTGADDEWQRL